MKRPTVRLELEVLEDRIVPAAPTVTTNMDNGNNNAPMPGSLRAAIIAVNNGAINQITFGVNTVNVTNASLPTITKPVIIDGSTAPVKSVEITTNNVNSVVSGYPEP